MLSPRMILTVGALASLPASRACLMAQAPAGGKDTPPEPVTLAVADFAGYDKEVGRFIAEALLTDLSVSDRLRLAERNALNQVMTELKLQATGLAEPQTARKLGKLVGVDFLVVGSYLERDDSLILNARLLDLKTGLVVRGGAGQAAGPRTNLLGVIHGLARIFHRRLTGVDLPGQEDASEPAARNGPEGPRPAAHTRAAPPETAEPPSLIPRGVSPNGVLRERDLAGLTARLRSRVAAQDPNPVTLMEPAAPVSRLRALAALVKLCHAREDIDAPRAARRLPPDTSEGPAWGKLYVQVAVEQGWWPAERPLRPRDNATWSFVEALLARMPLAEGPQVARRPEPEEPADPDAPTGLIVDARNLEIQRSPSMRILDQEGRIVYPSAAYIPDPDWLQENGTAGYYSSLRDARRAGNRPLIVSAIGVYGPGRDDLVVSNAMADRIRELNRRGRFLNTWKVAVLSTPRFPGYGR